MLLQILVELTALILGFLVAIIIASVMERVKNVWAGDL
jgi:ABC-type polysaccharide transport system permease subunit